MGPDPKPCVPLSVEILPYIPIPTPERADMHGKLVGYRGCGIMTRPSCLTHAFGAESWQN